MITSPFIFCLSTSAIILFSFSGSSDVVYSVTMQPFSANIRSAAAYKAAYLLSYIFGRIKPILLERFFLEPLARALGRCVIMMTSFFNKDNGICAFSYLTVFYQTIQM